VLEKNQGEIEKLDDYRSIVGKMMYYTTKLAPEFVAHLSYPGKEH
jgi:hypothetical protein